MSVGVNRINTTAEQTTSVISVATPNVGAVGATPQVDNAREIERLRLSHELYQKYSPLWEFYLSAYQGGEQFAIKNNLFRHPREHPDDFNERAKRVYYQNFCAPIVDFFTAFIFAETIQRDGGGNTAWYQDFIKDVNKKGDDITAFMRQICDDMQIFGLVYVLVDTPPKDVAIKTLAQEKEAGIRPYWVLISPLEVLNWVTDEFGKYLYVKRRQVYTKVDTQSFATSNIEKFTEWTQQTIKISEVDITDKDNPVLLSSVTIDNQLGQIPLQPIFYQRDKVDTEIGASFLMDIAFISREVMNLTSMLQEFLYRQCFNILAMEEDPNVDEISQMQGDIGTANL
jgi:hypothetical protein